MTKIRGFFPLCAALGALLAFTGTREVRAGTDYGIRVNVFDVSTSTDLGTTTLFEGGAADTSTDPNKIVIDSGTYSGAGALSLTGLNASLTENTTSTALSVGGTAQLIGTGDTYRLTVIVSHSDLLSPATGTAPVLSQSEQGNFQNTTSGGGQMQTNQSWYVPVIGPTFVTGGTTPGVQSLNVPSVTNGTMSVTQNNPHSANPPGYVTPYTLTDTVVLTIKGNTNNPSDLFSGSTTISVSSVPEPASLVMLLTGMPLPLVIVGMLRRRRKAAVQA